MRIIEILKEHTHSCGCDENCKCGASCEGKCGDEHCPCECGDRTGVGTNQCDLSVH